MRDGHGSGRDSIADGVTRQLDPRWIPVQRIHGAIFLAVVSMASFVGVIVLWIASRMLVAGLLLLPLWAVADGGARLAAVPVAADLLPPRVVPPRRRGLRDCCAASTGGRSPTCRGRGSSTPTCRRVRSSAAIGLGTLVVYTAGTQHSQVTLPGLDFTVARRIRAHLLPGDEGDAV